MNIHVPTTWMKITIVRTSTRTVGGNLTKKEIFGLWDGHEVEIVVDPTSPSSVPRHAYITSFEVGNEIEVKGALQVAGSSITLIVQQMRNTNVSSSDRGDSSASGSGGTDPRRSSSAIDVKLSCAIRAKFSYKIEVKFSCAIAIKPFID
ncbi:hypothetical protein BG011_000330 [Mortierella polycephala]|uniref:Uncharacterized protein n=1 Tax=Mortierella polycephala TaxID=41804 RepID=A0A9P6PMH0_9FUNG|nr:hypothetical protein BG011_000330 [Mortierella polycephala]